MADNARKRMHVALENVGKRRENPVVKAAVGAARSLVRGYDRKPTAVRNIAENGEANVLRKLGSHLGVVFDVGANVGEWTKFALDSGAKFVHDFEISPTTSAGLVQRYASDERVRVNTFGLSSAPGTVTINHYPDHPALTTMTEYPHDVPSVAVEVPVRTGDDYIAETGVDRIDFLKMDVEGAEQFVIQGLEGAFSRNIISVVQFEYGKVSILTKYLLRDFYADLTRHGFTVGRIGRDKVTFSDYDLTMEKFDDSNWLAVHDSHRSLIDVVS